MALAWLRERYNICISVLPKKTDKFSKNDFSFYIELYYKGKVAWNEVWANLYNFETFEEAVEAALKYSLEND